MGIRTSFPEQKAGFGARSQPPLSISEELQETVQIKQAKAYCLLTANPEDRISMRLPDCFHFMSCSSIRKKKTQRNVLFEEQSFRQSDYYKSFNDPKDFQIHLNPNLEDQILHLLPKTTS